MDYWKECIIEAFEDAGILATPKQIDIVISWVEGAHENYGMAHGHDAIPNPLALENKQLKHELKKERGKVICSECGGKGRIIASGPYHFSDSECWECGGEGKINANHP